MTAQKPWATLAAIIFLLVALIHLYRLAVPFAITIGATQVSQSASLVGLLIAGTLSVLLFRESRK